MFHFQIRSVMVVQMQPWLKPGKAATDATAGLAG
jgi:hypothetical protein